MDSTPSKSSLPFPSTLDLANKGEEEEEDDDCGDDGLILRFPFGEGNSTNSGPKLTDTYEVLEKRYVTNMFLFTNCRQPWSISCFVGPLRFPFSYLGIR